MPYRPVPNPAREGYHIGKKPESAAATGAYPTKQLPASKAKGLAWLVTAAEVGEDAKKPLPDAFRGGIGGGRVPRVGGKNGPCFAYEIGGGYDFHVLNRERTIALNSGWKIRELNEAIGEVPPKKIFESFNYRRFAPDAAVPPA